MISFILPGFFEKLNLNKYLLFKYKNNNEIFNDNTKIETFFGTFHFCVWNGGRIFNKYNRAFKEDVEEIISFYNSQDIPIRLTFTNQFIKNEILKDPYCNLICSIANEYSNEVLVQSKELEEYLSLNYPNLKICSSTTKCLTDLNEIKEEINNPIYHQICLDYNINKNINFLENLTQKEKDKIELLCNAICISNCPHRKEHYYLNDISNLNLGSPYMINCGILENTVHPNTENYPNHINLKDIKNIYEPLGIKHFKLEGRTLSDNELLTNYAKYLIKPEYQFNFISQYAQ